ncbi:LysE family transporter [Actinoplanes friuliensis]|uniref:Lysine exporter protein n=1 Tax=Actinoplanes friuliensis DSM 7358 TaxID=1246995 RepID=U5VUD9_9ACTN|nr:LysE family transporter [Actinoplanes friuliensis]AGZ40437.1 lysine exporter protein [Actinoplanes friuliensis DSM 7358]
MTGPFVAGVIAGYGVAVPVGAIAVLIAGLTARTSLRVGAAAGLGAATADGIYALLAVLGGAALAGAVAPIATPLRWAAAGVLLLLAAHTAWSALRKPAVAASTDTTTAGAAYLGVLVLTLLNPMTIVYFAALVLGRGGAGGGVWFVLGAFLASASWQLLIAGGGSLIGQILTGPRGRRTTALISSAVITILAISLITH